ncbi:MAG: hypothetical protein HYX74_07890, partial [Acidobacteria bacterium]|nr:hypothetical protein [Acidobacteriota bacterium]
ESYRCSFPRAALRSALGYLLAARLEKRRDLGTLIVALFPGLRCAPPWATCWPPAWKNGGISDGVVARVW